MPGSASRTEREPNALIRIDQNGVVVGNGTYLLRSAHYAENKPQASSEDRERCLALMSIASGSPVSANVLGALTAAADYWRRGDKVIAGLRLAFADIPRLRDHAEVERLRLAEQLLDAGFHPKTLLTELGIDPAYLDVLEKFDPEQPRVPAGSGQTSGQWTSGHATASAGAVALPAAAEAGTLASGLFGAGAGEFLAGLAQIGLRFAGPTSLLGAVILPSPNNVASEGSVPGEPSLRYSLNSEDGTLRFLQSGAHGSELIAAAQLGHDGIFYETQTGIPVARAVDGSVVFDPAYLANVADPTSAAALTDAESKEDEPQLCPAPGKDAPHGASDRAIAYQAQISALNNPQRPLPPGMGASLINPATGRRVYFDDCREADGTMIEAKGPGYEKMLRSSYFADQVLPYRWTNQATRQVSAAAARDVDWFFAEEKAAGAARRLFDGHENLQHINVITVPAILQ